MNIHIGFDLIYVRTRVRVEDLSNTGVPSFVGFLGGVHSFGACLSRMNIDHASLARRSTVPTAAEQHTSWLKPRPLEVPSANPSHVGSGESALGGFSVSFTGNAI